MTVPTQTPLFEVGAFPVRPNPLIISGDPNSTPPDRPDRRIDPNTTTSPFAGVGSIDVSLPGVGNFLGSGTPISRRHILTAAHLLDVQNDDGIIDVIPSEVTFNLNYGQILSHRIKAARLNLFPAYEGFNASLSDDLAIITLREDLPAEMPIYPLYRQPLEQGDVLTMVGYGTTGDGLQGYIPGSAAFDIKRVGQNQVDLSLSGAFLFDFDGSTPDTNLFQFFGSNSGLGNDLEATLGPGDSGGPSFIQQGNTYLLAGVNTFAFSIPEGFGLPGTISGTFGTGAGGVVVSNPDKLSWIDSILALLPPQSGSNNPPPITDPVLPDPPPLVPPVPPSPVPDPSTPQPPPESPSEPAIPPIVPSPPELPPVEPSPTEPPTEIPPIAPPAPDQSSPEPPSPVPEPPTEPPMVPDVIAQNGIATPSRKPTALRGTRTNDVLMGTARADTIWAGNGDDRVNAAAGNDAVTGGRGNDRLWGSVGSDRLWGNAGGDRLVGGIGDDWLVGGAGADVLVGGEGSDRFSIAALDAMDVIVDFNPTVDRLDLSPILQHPAFTSTNSLQNYIRITSLGSSSLISIDSNGSAVGAEFLPIALLKNIRPSELQLQAL